MDTTDNNGTEPELTEEDRVVLRELDSKRLIRPIVRRKRNQEKVIFGPKAEELSKRKNPKGVDMIKFRA